MDNESLTALENAIVGHIEAGLAEGFKLVPFAIREGKSCCAIGMVVRDLPKADYNDHTQPIFANTLRAADRLGIDLTEAMQIEYGFDSGTNSGGNPFRAIGVRLHERYNQTPAT